MTIALGKVDEKRGWFDNVDDSALWLLLSLREDAFGAFYIEKSG